MIGYVQKIRGVCVIHGRNSSFWTAAHIE